MSICKNLRFYELSGHRGTDHTIASLPPVGIGVSKLATKTKEIICGIDPGKRGAICFLEGINNPKKMHSMYLMPEDEIDVAPLLAAMKPSHIFIEKAQAMPNQGSVSMFNYGKHYGKLLALCHLFCEIIVEVRPRDWTRVIHQGLSLDLPPKERSRIAAHAYFPGTNWRPTKRHRKDHDGLIDAALIAKWGAHKLWNERNCDGLF